MPKLGSNPVVSLVIGTFLFSPTVLASEAPSPKLARAQTLLDSGQFEEAVKALDSWLDTAELTEKELTAMYGLLGLAHLYLGDEKQAAKAFKKLFQTQPDYELPSDAPPKVLALYQRIRANSELTPRPKCEVALSPQTNLEGGKPATMTATLSNCAANVKTRLFFRRAGEDLYHSVDFVSRTAAIYMDATIPGYFLPAGEAPWPLEYYAEVTDAASRRLDNAGDAFSPLRCTVSPLSTGRGTAPTSATAWHQNPWVWAGAGAVAVGAIVGGILLFTPPEPRK